MANFVANLQQTKGVARGFNQLLASGALVQKVAHSCFKILSLNLSGWWKKSI